MEPEYEEEYITEPKRRPFLNFLKYTGITIFSTYVCKSLV